MYLYHFIYKKQYKLTGLKNHREKQALKTYFYSLTTSSLIVNTTKFFRILYPSQHLKSVFHILSFVMQLAMHYPVHAEEFDENLAELLKYSLAPGRKPYRLYCQQAKRTSSPGCF